MYYRNINRGYMKPVVWQDAKQLYKLSWAIFSDFDYRLKRVKGNQMASVDAVHRNISEGYCRKGINEYLQYLNIALSSLGESVSSMYVYLETHDIDKKTFEEWDALAYKLENGLISLIKSLRRKRDDGTWKDDYTVHDPENDYNRQRPIHSSSNAILQQYNFNSFEGSPDKDP